MRKLPETMTIPEAMEALHCSRSYIENLMYSGKITYYKPTKRHALIDVNSLNKLFRPY
ncbi:MAG: helix-turn-helix domain-containing protein [Bifidobacterium crudilactis]|jgi:excisionase family DNA binding protein|nr:helix-turn-helix domain-containing protein [Bifidobacterium crudilactis]